MDEEQKQRWLHKVATESRYRAYRRANHAPKNLESSGHPHLISAVDPNPPVVMNKPKARFSKVQREYLKSVYYRYAVYGGLKREEARHAFEVRSEWSEGIKGGDKVQDRKAANRSSKRSAKNLAEYGYVTLSYDYPREYEGDPFQNRANLFQPVLYVMPTMAAAEKGREFREQDGEPTDPLTLREQTREMMAQWGYKYKGL